MKSSNLTTSLLLFVIFCSCNGKTSEDTNTEVLGQVVDSNQILAEISEVVQEPQAAAPVKEDENREPLLLVDPKLKNSENIIDFRYRGRIINPFILEEFVKFAVSDRHSSIREVDLTVGNESNRFYFEDSRLFMQQERNLKYIVYPEKEPYPDNRLYLRYAYLGKLNNGLHIVILEEIQETSNDYKTLLALRFHSEKVYYDDQPHTFITCVKTEEIYQYVNYKLDARNNRVQVIPISNYTQSDFSELEKNAYWVKF